MANALVCGNQRINMANLRQNDPCTMYLLNPEKYLPVTISYV